jgi:AGZA family xanthine/uracil permease-like MFS transporter
MAVTGGGAVLGALLLGAIAAFVIDRRFNWAAVYAAAATMFSYFGFIHSERLAFNASPGVSFGYGMSALVFAFLAWREWREQGKLDWSPIDNGSEPMH